MSKILLVGDIHSRYDNLINLEKSALAQGLDIDFVIQCGDFGFFETYFNKMSFLPIPTMVIEGNHDDKEYINEQDYNKWELDYNLFYMERGTIQELNGSIIGFMGGALNVDRRQHGSIDKRTTNYILDVEVNEFLEKAKKYPKIDLLVTHSCPHSVGVGMVGSPIFFESIEKFCHDKGHSTGRNEDCGDGALTKLYKGLNALQIPVSNWIFGHFHSYKMSKIGTTNFYCIGCGDSSDGKLIKNPFIYDTKTHMIDFCNKINLDI